MESGEGRDSGNGRGVVSLLKSERSAALLLKTEVSEAPAPAILPTATSYVQDQEKNKTQRSASIDVQFAGAQHTIQYPVQCRIGVFVVAVGSELFVSPPRN